MIEITFDDVYCLEESSFGYTITMNNGDKYELTYEEVEYLGLIVDL